MVGSGAMDADLTRAARHAVPRAQARRGLLRAGLSTAGRPWHRGVPRPGRRRSRGEPRGTSVSRRGWASSDPGDLRARPGPSGESPGWRTDTGATRVGGPSSRDRRLLRAPDLPRGDDGVSHGPEGVEPVDRHVPDTGFRTRCVRIAGHADGPRQYPCGDPAPRSTASAGSATAGVQTAVRCSPCVAQAHRSFAATGDRRVASRPTRRRWCAVVRQAPDATGTTRGDVRDPVRSCWRCCRR